MIDKPPSFAEVKDLVEASACLGWNRLPQSQGGLSLVVHLRVPAKNASHALTQVSSLPHVVASTAELSTFDVAPERSYNVVPEPISC